MPLIITSKIAKAVSKISRFFGLGAGVTWAGEIGLILNPNTISSLIPEVKKGVIVIAGTNGKTTTSAMIEHVLTNQGFKVIHNKTGANLENGIVGTLLLNTDFKGKLSADYAIFELDEATFAHIIPKLKPSHIILLNLFRDQLDRYGEVDSIASKWLEGLKNIGSKTMLVANADDPLISSIGEAFKENSKYFGLDDKRLTLKKHPHAVDSIYCFKCGNKLSYTSIYLSHYGDWYCKKCGRKRPKLDLSKVDSPMPGVYNIYNSLAAVLAGKTIHIDEKAINSSLSSFKPAFGRQEEFLTGNKKIKLFLSKNPAGFNESIRTVIQLNNYSTIIFALNDRIADGTDVSWIWDVDFEDITKKSHIICTGDRVYDMALRIKYAEVDQEKIQAIEETEIALSKGLESIKEGETLYIFSTYTAMLEIRKVLTGKKIL